MVIAVQGEGLLAILSTDCLDPKPATVPSSGWRGPGSASSPQGEGARLSSWASGWRGQAQLLGLRVEGASLSS